MFGPESSNGDVFEGTGRMAAQQAVRRGVNAAIFAYGQTGSGKSHTLGMHVGGDGGGVAQMTCQCFFEELKKREEREMKGTGDAWSNDTCTVKYIVSFSVYEVRRTSDSSLVAT